MFDGTCKPKYNDHYDTKTQIKMRILTPDGHLLSQKGKLCERLHSSGAGSTPNEKQATATQRERENDDMLLANHKQPRLCLDYSDIHRSCT